MNNKLLLATIVSLALLGCNDDNPQPITPSDPAPPTQPESPTEPPISTPPVEIIPQTTYIGSLLTSGQAISGDVHCNGQSLIHGSFEVMQGVSFNCTLEAVELGQFTAPFPNAESVANPSEKVPVSFDVLQQHGTNATLILQSIDRCGNDTSICLNSIDSYEIADVYQQLHDQNAVDAYLAAIKETITDEVGKTPSSHVDPEIAPEVTPGSNNNLDADFVAANAEQSYSYTPSSDAQVLTSSTLSDAQGRPLAGISYFSTHATGITNSAGEFEFLWGDELTFGIDTFELGSIKGNQLSFKITDVTHSSVEKDNIQSLLERYGSITSQGLAIDSRVSKVFSQYPNVINELINLRLPNGGFIDGSDGMTVPDEFEGQFELGITALIDAQLKQDTSLFSPRPPSVHALDNGQYVTQSLNAIFKNVDSFHVFHDNQGGYGATGHARGNLSINLSNQAFPVMMPRSDNNRLLRFGEAQAWTRDGKPYIAQHPTIAMQAIPKVADSNVTYGLPFVVAGLIGEGKVVFMGNSVYPTILSCPELFWANSFNEVKIDSRQRICTSVATSDDPRSDQGAMQQYFSNLFDWFSDAENKTVASNIKQAAFSQANVSAGMRYDFFIHDSYGLEAVNSIASGEYHALDPVETPILILQAYKLNPSNNSANLDEPHLSQEDITALITYINAGGNVLFMDGIESANPEPIGRLADAAGVSIGGQSVVSTSQSLCAPDGRWCNNAPTLNHKQEKEVVVIQHFENLANGKQPFTVHDDGSVSWVSDNEMASTPLHVPTYEVTDENGKVDAKRAMIRVNNAQEREAAIKELQHAFTDMPVCTHEYEYEFNCIEVRSGTGVLERAYGRQDFERIYFQTNSMVKAANLGDNIQALADHELYYRSKGALGQRLAITELNQTYDNLSTWLWNNNNYYYDPQSQDELGFKRLIEFMNCYTNDSYAGNGTCPPSLKNTLIANNMIIGEGELAHFVNPSYPLNYQEKPLTRIMLGRSFWDYRIKVDTTAYPTRPTTLATTSETVTIETDGTAVNYTVGNTQSTGLWLPQHEIGTVTGGVKAQITVMFADDLTGRSQHETNLNRPPRMTKTFLHDGGSTQIQSPYGGLVYVRPLESAGASQFHFSGVMKAPLFKEGHWVTTPQQSQVQMAEIDSGSFVYTTHVNNVTETDLATFVSGLNRFADAASDFYGRDDWQGAHRRYTYADLKGFRHRFVNDVQISIGSAHSGYPVMNSAFDSARNTVPTDPLNDWLLWHEVGHNLASAPFNVTGGTEVTNNLLALYMQELEGRNDNPRMDRIVFEIQKAPHWLERNARHAWANGDAGVRLIMFGQLKIWAKSHFSINHWYDSQPSSEKASIYGNDEGWNMIKLMHRLARNNQDTDGTNYCDASVTGLSDGDLLMVCSSYVSGYDLSDFFLQWNVGEEAMNTAQGAIIYSGGISAQGLNTVAQMQLPTPQKDPLLIDSLTPSTR
ncbi:SslE/AcfD family lipoprotein zinc metalloprotease [Vibrio rarus]|uniref:SslE/AcfD family lipoprotein zinc metalloprotease n=1 Tax=Vibrio rarus TaxID=413403 RepID=UPI0021C2C467|nr:SslE/AcfD family lipoprotein zinc metalloprotease [Vibrio rarus]